MMKKFREWEKLNEIGDRIITPSIIKKYDWPFDTTGNDDGKTFFYNIQIDETVYVICIQLITRENKTALKIDFGKSSNGNMTADMTNLNNMLKVMSNLVGVFKEWLKDYKGNETIYSVIIEGKSEFSDDVRRSKIYDSYTKSYLQKINCDVKEIADITAEWTVGAPSNHPLSKVLKYRIEPVTLDKIRIAIEN